MISSLKIQRGCDGTAMIARTKPLSSRLVSGAAAVVLLAVSATASAQSWIGTTGGAATNPNSGNWKTAANWQPGTVPSPSESTILSFGGSSGTAYTSTNDFTGNGFNFQSIVLNSTAPVRETINGTGLQLSNTGSSIVQNGSGAIDIQNGIQSTQTGQSAFAQLWLKGDGAGRMTLSGVISDHDTTHTAGLLKTGQSTFVLTNANSYSANTQVSGGTLLVNNTAGSGTGTGNVTVDGSGTLGGTGTISTAATKTIAINSGGTINPGDPTVNGGIGALTLSATTISFGTGATLVIDLSGNSSDLLSLTGAVTIASSMDTLQLNVFSPLTVNTYHLVTGTLAGIFDVVNGVPSGFHVVQSAAGIDLIRDPVPVPEPGTWISGALAVSAVVGGRLFILRKPLRKRR